MSATLPPGRNPGPMLPTVRTPDDRTVIPAGNAEAGYSSVEVLSPSSARTSFFRDVLENLKNSFMGDMAEAGLRSLADELTQARQDFIGVCRTSSDAQDLTIYVADDEAAQKMVAYLARQGHVDQPRTNQQSARLELNRTMANLAGGNLTLRVAVKPPLADAVKALSADLDSISRAMSKPAQGQVSLRVDGETLVLGVSTEALRFWDQAGPELFMLAKGEGAQGERRLSWMGYEVRVAPMDRVSAGPSTSPADRDALLARFGQALEQGVSVTARIMEGVALGAPQRLVGINQQGELVWAPESGANGHLTLDAATMFARDFEVTFGAGAAPSLPLPAALDRLDEAQAQAYALRLREALTALARDPAFVQRVRESALSADEQAKVQGNDQLVTDNVLAHLSGITAGPSGDARGQSLTLALNEDYDGDGYYSALRMALNEVSARGPLMGIAQFVMVAQIGHDPT